VPFIPGSNLELVWDGTSWTLRLIIDNGQSAKRGQAGSGTNKGAKGANSGSKAGSGTNKGAKGANSGSGRKPDDKLASLKPDDKLASLIRKDKLASLIRTAKVQSTEDQPTAAAAAAAEWGQDGGMAPPYYQGQCVPCPEGSHVEGNMCE
jgi:hypothetical protein